MTNRYVIAFTGHRPPKLGGYGITETKSWLSNVISDKLREYALKGPIGVMSGCAQGTDQIAAFEAWLLKREGLDVKLTMVMPYPSFGENWPWQAWKHLEWLLDQADQRIVVSQGPYEVWKLQARNEYLVDYSNLLIAVHDGSSGGTDNTIKYAISKGRPFLRVNPRTKQTKFVEPLNQKNTVQLRLI